MASGTRKEVPPAGRQRVSCSGLGREGRGEGSEEPRPVSAAWLTRPPQGLPTTSTREPDGGPAAAPQSGKPKDKNDASGAAPNNKGNGDGSSGSSTQAAEPQLNPLPGGAKGQAQKQPGSEAVQTGTERAQRTAKITAIAALMTSNASPARQKNASAATQRTGDRATTTATTNNNNNNDNRNSKARVEDDPAGKNRDNEASLLKPPEAPRRWWGAFGKRGGTGALRKRPALQPTEADDLNDQARDQRPPKAPRQSQNRPASRSASPPDLANYRQTAAEAAAAAAAQYGSLLMKPPSNKDGGKSGGPPWRRQQSQQQQNEPPNQQSQVTQQQQQSQQQQQQQPAATSQWRKKTRELRNSATGVSNTAHQRPGRPGHVVAHEAAELPPDQLCNPLVIMSLMALSRKAAEQHCKDVLSLLPSIRRQTSAVAQRGLLEAERLARKTAEAQLSTLQKELATAHLNIQQLRAGPGRGASKAAAAAPTADGRQEAEKARQLRLAADADLERSLRKAAEAALAEAEGSIESLATSAAEAEKTKVDTQANLARMEELFRRERRAWEYDALDLETLAARSKGETLMVETSLKESERCISELQEELKVEKAIKERAMAFISQRALMSSQEQETLMERHRQMSSSIPSAFDQNPRKVQEAAAQAAAAAFAAAAAAEAVAVRAAQQTQQQHPAPPLCMPYVGAASLPSTAPLTAPVAGSGAVLGSGGGSIVRPRAHYRQAAAPRRLVRDPAPQVSFHRTQSERSPASLSDD